MNPSERRYTITILTIISFMTLFDIATDMKEGVDIWHLSVESIVAIIALVGAYLLLKESFYLQRSLKKEKEFSSKLVEESQHWKSQSKKYLEGLSQSIDQQLNAWKLTPAEKEVAFLLIKGFSLKEIAHFRDTAEKTTRGQTTIIYSKSGLSGRSQLAAFFLEDLLIPEKMNS